MARINEKELLNMWWNLSNITRGTMSSDKATIVLTGLYVLKFILDNKDSLELHGDCSWDQVSSSGVDAERIQSITRDIEQSNPDFRGFFTDMDLYSGLKQVDDSLNLMLLIHELDKVSFDYEDMENSDFLDGTIALSADGWFERMSEISGGRGGESSTPLTINELSVGLLSFPVDSVYDGTCGLCGNLIAVARAAKRSGSPIPRLFGQEINPVTLSLGKANMVLHGLDIGGLALGNTLSEPRWTEGAELQKFDSVVMNPPFALKVQNKEILERDRFFRYRYGIPSAAFADMAFVQHALSSLRNTGKAVLAQPHGVLVRGGIDEQIRKGMLEDGLIEAVIFLPRNLLINTNIPIVILVLNKDNPHPESVLFIKADEKFDKGRIRNELRKEDLDQILHVYQTCQEKEDYSRLVPLSEIADNEWNLNITRYVESMKLEDSKAGPVKVSIRKYNTLETLKVRLKNVADVERGSGSARNVEEDDQGDYRLVNLGDINEYGILDVESTKPVSANKKARQNELRSGDILISSRGTPFKVAVVPEVDVSLIASDNFIVVKLRKDFQPYYVKSFLESPIGMQLLFSLQRGSGVPVLSHRDLEELEIPSLPINLQIEIADAAVKADERYLAALDSAKKAYEASYRNVYQIMNLDDAIEIEEGGTLS